VITRSELCKLVGVSRKTLIHYKEIKLLEPFPCKKNAPWIYPDDAIDKLLFIRLLKEAEYSLEQIKGLATMENVDEQAEIDKMIDTLTKKRNRINGMLNYLYDWKTRNALPQTTKEVFNRMDFKALTKGRSYNKMFDEAINMYSTLPGDFEEKVELYGPLGYQLIAIGLMQDENPDSKKVKELVKRALDFLSTAIGGEWSDEEIQDFMEYSECDKAACLFANLETKFAKDENILRFEDLAGKGACEYVLNAVRAYGESCCRDGEDFDQLLTEFEEN